MKTEILQVNKLNPAKYNPRKINKKSFEGLKKSIITFGYVEPIIVNQRTGFTVIGGHQRLKALIELGIKEALCVVLDISEIKEKALNVALNNRHTSGEFDESGLEKILLELKDGLDEFDDLNFDDLALEFDFDLDDEHEGACSEDIIPEEPEVVVIKMGDLIEIGEHRLLCGDSTDKEQVEYLMDGEKADLLTDPPYGISAEKMTLGTGKKDFHRGEWDSKIPDFFDHIVMFNKFILWGANYYTDKLVPSNNWLCWYKKNDGLSFSEFELAYTNLGKNCRHISHHWSGETKQHPTQKPLPVFIWCINMLGDKVCDLFLGSGTTLIACEKTNRKCYGMELDEKYVSVVISRYCDYTNNYDIKINGKKINWIEYQNEQN